MAPFLARGEATRGARGVAMDDVVKDTALCRTCAGRRNVVVLADEIGGYGTWPS